VSAIYPGFIRDAGMFAKADVKLPPGTGTRSPEDVAAAVIKAIQTGRAEIDVAPLALRIGTKIGELAPRVAAMTTRLTGGDKIADQLADAHRAGR
jgi:hypothetical protein